ncbi:MAG TPA: hypothetical protein DEB40_03395 [Elusimicrobia bacterium]|nr:hypothetical protein [Elusimicrobiota bacterium]HBT60773.1 hypothetical protein [Elusimicrobiota bacterium]
MSETLSLFKSLPDRLLLALLQAMREVAIDIQSRAKVNAPVFRGLLRVSILQSVSVDDRRIVGRVGSALTYAPVIEYGRASGWFPPVNELRIWARRKLGDERAGFLVARAIKRRGFKAQPYLLPALEAARPRVQLIFDARIKQAIQALGGDV